jgi:hypothetical protein
MGIHWIPEILIHNFTCYVLAHEAKQKSPKAVDSMLGRPIPILLTLIG